MVEINKKLFMDINTFRKTPDCDRVKSDVSHTDRDHKARRATKGFVRRAEKKRAVFLRQDISGHNAADQPQ